MTDSIGWETLHPQIHEYRVAGVPSVAESSGLALDVMKNSRARSSNITLRYFPIAGRGELARLYAVAGGLHITDSMQHGRSYKNDTLFGFLPVLDDPLNGLFGLQESLAVERYVAAMAPGFAGLTPQERALDDMFAQSKEDLLQVLGPKVYFGNRSSAPYVVPPLLDRYFGVWEKLLPEDGFLHGHAFPTGADLAVLVVCKSAFPFVTVMELAGYGDWETRFPRVHALAERTADAPAVAQYLQRSNTFYAVPSIALTKRQDTILMG
jgi:glutathione S-transferase